MNLNYNKLIKQQLYDICKEKKIITDKTVSLKKIKKNELIEALTSNKKLPEKKRNLSHAKEERDFVKIMNNTCNDRIFYHNTDKKNLTKEQEILLKDTKIDAYSIKKNTNEIQLYQLKKGNKFNISNWISDEKIKEGILKQNINFKDIIEKKFMNDETKNIIKQRLIKYKICKNNAKISGFCLMITTDSDNLSIYLEKNENLMNFITPNYNFIELITYNKKCKDEDYINAYNNKKLFNTLENIYLRIRVIYTESGNTNNSHVLKSYINSNNFEWYENYLNEINN